jgi:beta-lactamase regulating signal transducer with metallopeptidase domain
VKEFLQSHFLQALAQSLIASIWQMALLWLATIFLLKLLRLSSAQKFNIAFSAQLSGFSLFIYNCIHNYFDGTATIIASETSAKILLNINNAVIALMPFIALIYICIVLFKLTKLLYTYKHAKGLKSYEVKKIAADKRIFVQQVSELFSLRRKVSIFLSAKIICPLTIGFLKPVILIPVAAINQLTTEQMEAVILHELAHIKRADYLLFILQSIVEKFFFFNIFSLMLSTIIERERENTCDDWVLQFRYNSQHYAEALFKLGRLKASPVFSMQFTGKKENLLLTRIKRLLHSQHKTTYNLQGFLFGVCNLLFAACLMVSVATKPAKKTISISYKPVEKQQTLIANTSNKNKVGFQQKSIDEVKKTVAQNESILNKPVSEKDQQKAKLDEAQQNLLALKQNYLVDVKQQLDSLNNALPKISEALNSQVIVTPDVLRKVTSYQNFKQLENMLAASGDSITVKETDASKNSYQKEITIEAFDKKGNKHVYTVIVQLYQ